MAERSVSVRLKMDVAGFTAGSRAAGRDLSGLNRKMGETAGAASGMRKKLEDAVRKLPKIEIDANSTAADLKVAEVRDELEKLSQKKIGVDINADQAFMQMQVLRAELVELERGASFDVKAGISQALGELAAVDAEVNRLTGNEARVQVDADVSGALASIGLVGAALSATAALPALAVMGAGAVALGGAFAVAGAGVAGFAAVATPSLERINQGLQEQEAAALKARRAAGELTPAWNDLSAAEKAMAGELKKFRQESEAWQRSLQPEVFPAMVAGMDLFSTAMTRSTPLVRGSSVALGQLAVEADEALNGPWWSEFFDNLGVQAPTAVLGLGHSLGNVGAGVAGIVDAFLLFMPVVVGGAEDATEAFAKWGQQLKNSPEFREFIFYVRENAPEVWELIKGIAGAGGDIVTALAPLGLGSLSGLSMLAQLVAGMDPEHIQLIALAIVAIKVAQSGLRVASFFTEFGGAVDRAKSKAAGLGDAIGGLGGKLGLLGGVVGGAALAGGLLVLESRLSANADAASKFTEKVSALGGGNVDQEIAAVTRAIEEQRSQIGFAVFDTIYFSDAQRAAADNVEALESRLAELKHSKELDSIASKAAADAAGEHGRKVGELNTALDAFAGRTDAYQAARNLEKAYKDTAAALDAANGKMSISRGMTDAQKDAVIRARESFSGYIESIRTAADGAQTLSGRTSDGTKAVLEQLPRLTELAGKNRDAKEQVLLLAKAYGISAADAAKASKGGKDLKEVLADLKSKQLRIDMDTRAAQANLNNIQRTLIDIARRADLQLKGGLNPTSARGNAWGGIQNRNGAPDYMAMGGIRSLGSSPAAMIARSPALISGRGGPDVIMGEAGWEAFIPLDPSKRGRGMQVLGEAASIMGMAVVPEQIALNTAGSTSAASGGQFLGAGGAMVTVTGIDALRGALDATAVDLTGSLGGATAALDATLGDAGTLTSSLAGVGEIAGYLAGEVTGWGEVISSEVPPLTDAVTLLGTAISAAASSAGDAKGATGSKGDERSPRAGSSSKGATGSKGDERSPRGAASKTGISASAVKSTQPLGMSASAVKTTQKIEPPKKIALQGAASITSVAMSGGTNWSRTSRPVQAAPSTSGGPASSTSGGSSEGTLSSRQVAGSLVHIDTLTVREQADVDVVAAALYSRLGSKGV
ncbi:hypothetical protein [Streptosporangium sp. NPDC002524]|uniref:hypothetical protein n=1 Tax=Streptosporangium sp. NPDC002524 TaxID=3154537 RepID=UPI0033301F87